MSCVAQLTPLISNKLSDMRCIYFTHTQEAKEHGCKNVLALRGDPPRGATEWQPIENGFVQAVDLIRYIRTHFGDHFDIAIAGFPEGHPDSPDRKQELQWVKEKVDAGANFIITQMFYDADGTLLCRWGQSSKNTRVLKEFAPHPQCSSTGRAT